MKKIKLFFGIISIVGLASCSQQQETKDSPPPPAAENNTPAPVDTPKSDGTTIKVSDEGVSYSNKNGQKENKVNVSQDSTSVEIKTPK